MSSSDDAPAGTCPNRAASLESGGGAGLEVKGICRHIDRSSIPSDRLDAAPWFLRARIEKYNEDRESEITKV